MRVSVLSVVIVAVGLVGVASTALGQPGPPAPPEALNLLVGEWTGAGTLTDPEHAGVAVQGTMSCTPTAGGFAVLCTGHWTGADGLTHDEADLFGQDMTGDGLLHFYAVTADGFAHDHPGSYDEATGFTFEHIGMMGGSLFSERIHITVDGAVQHYTVEVMVGQTRMMTFEADITRS